MTEYSKVQKRIWNSKTFNQLSEDGKFFWLYVLTSPHSNMLGFYILKPGYAQEDLDWSTKRFDKSLHELLGIQLSNGCEGLIKYDPDNNLILIKNYLEHNPLKNPNQVKAACRKLSDLPFSPLFQEFKLLLEQLGKQLGKQLYEPLLEQLGKPVAVTVAVTISETEANSAPQIPFTEIIFYLNKKTQKSFTISKETKQYIKARWNSGFRLDDFKKVIDNKCAKWLTDEKMVDYLRPQTLFGTKFESYLNEKPAVQQGVADPFVCRNCGKKADKITSGLCDNCLS